MAFEPRKLELAGSSPTAMHNTSRPISSLSSGQLERQLSSAHRDLLAVLAGGVQTLRRIKQVHALSLLNGFLHRDISLCASLILRYAGFRDAGTCRRLFESSLPHSRTAFLWNTLIRGLNIAGIDDEFRTYNRMVRHGVRPDDHTFPFVLKACADNLSVQKGVEIHAAVFKFGLDADVYVGNNLLQFYGSCGCLRDAEKMFDEMRERDVVSWNTAIGVFSDFGLYAEAMELYCKMNLRSGFRPNMVTVVSMLPVCSGLEDGVMGSQIHCYVVKVGIDCQVVICNALVNFYGKCGNVKASRKVFDEMEERNEESWNAMITGLAHLGQNEDALKMFRLMINEDTKSNSVTISKMLHVLVELELFDLGKEIHGLTLRFGIESDVFIANSLIDLYAKSGHPFKASSVFHQISEKNVVSWNTMVANFAQNGLEFAALDLVRQMQVNHEIPNGLTFTNVLPACSRAGFLGPGKEIHARVIRMDILDLFVSNAVIDMYAKCGSQNLARNVFNFSLRDEVSYNTLIEGYSQTAECAESLNLFLEMELKGWKHDVVSYIGAIKACTNLAALKQGKAIHGLVIRKHFHTHLFIANKLLDFYIKCGRIGVARKVFDRIQNKDAASWNAVISGYGMIGELKTAIDLFEAMRENGVQYDSVSYIAVLSACSHGGLVEMGKKYFEQMQYQNIMPTQMHYACMVDLLGRAGLMEEAVAVIKSMPAEPDANAWGALLGACRTYGNIELATCAAEHLFRLKPGHSGYYATLSNMYAEAGKWNEANRVRELMKSRGTAKNPGCSWVQVDSQVHAYVAGEKIEKLDPVPQSQGCHKLIENRKL